MSEKRIRVFREPTHSKGYVSINNATLQDIRLSYRARGLLAYILSKPTTFQHNAESLVTASEGKAAIRAALKELRSIGYATLVKYRDELGKCRHRWEFRETPSADFQHTAPSTPKPGFGEPGSGAPNLGESVRIRNDGLRNHGSRNDGGGEAPAPVLFPWASLQDMPEHLRDRFSELGARAEEVFRSIRGRKLKHGDKHPLRDWEDVLRAEIDAALKEAMKGKNSRGFSDRQDYSGVREKLYDRHTEHTERYAEQLAAAVKNGLGSDPHNWRQRLAEAEPGNVYSPGGRFADTPWFAIDRVAQRQILKLIGEAAS